MLRNLSALAALLLASGCSWFSWLPGIDAKEKDASVEPAELVKFDKEADVKRLWRASIGSGLGRKYLRLNPAVLADRVCAADAYGTVECHDRFTGKRVWRAQIGKAEKPSVFKFWDRRDPSFVTGGVGIGGGRVLIGTTAGDVVALDVADGSEMWRTSVSSEVLAAPAGDDEVVVVQTGDGRLLALEADDGTVRWSFDTQVPILTLRGTAAPVLSGNLVFAGFAAGKVSALRADSGEPIWEARVALPQGRSELDRMVDVDTSPLVGPSFVFAACYQGKIKALRRSDGAQVWEQDTSTFLDLAQGYGHVYVVDEHDVITAIDQQSSAVIWEQAGLRNRDLTSPVAFGNYVVVGDAKGYVHVMAQSDGRFVARRKIDGDGLRSAMAVAEGTVYLLSNDGALNALEVRRVE